MGIIRIKKTKNYSVISNQIASDPNISWGAKGLLFYLLTRPDNWQTKIEHLKTVSIDGRDGTNSIMKQLISAGYATRSEKIIKKGGKFIGYDYTIHEKPLRPNSNGGTVTVKPEIINTEGINTEGINTDKESFNKLKDNSVSKETPKPININVEKILYKILPIWSFKKHRVYKKNKTPTELVKRLNSIILSIKKGKFCREYRLDAVFRDENKKGIKILKSLKGQSWDKIQLYLIKSVKRYLRMKNPQYEPINKKILTDDFSIFLYNPNAQKSYFIHALNSSPRKRYEQISEINSEKIKENLPLNVQEIGDKNYDNKYDLLEYWKKIKVLWNWHEKSTPTLQKKSSSFYGYLGSFERFMVVYSGFLKESGFKNLGNFGYKNKTWRIFVEWIDQEYDIDLKED